MVGRQTVASSASLAFKVKAMSVVRLNSTRLGGLLVAIAGGVLMATLVTSWVMGRVRIPSVPVVSSPSPSRSSIMVVSSDLTTVTRETFTLKVNAIETGVLPLSVTV